MADKAKETMERMRNVKMPQGGGGPAARAAGMLLAGGIGVALLASQSIYTVDAGHRAVLFNRVTGLKSGPGLGEGIHFRIPWFEWPSIYDVRKRPRNMKASTGSRDLQTVNVGVRVLHRPDTGQLQEIHRTLGMDYDERVLPSIVNEVCKQVVAQFNASQLITQRERVSQMIHQNLLQRAANFNIIVDDTSITELRFGREYSSAVERKQVAQQEAERARFVVDKAVQEKRSIVVKAQGEAESAALIGQALKQNPAFLQLRRIDAAQQISRIIAGSQNKFYLGSDTLMIGLVGQGGDKTSN